jgi:hypothetical protein
MGDLPERDDLNDEASAPIKASDGGTLDRFPLFSSLVCARLDAGQLEYGDRSFSRPSSELLDEIEEELLDVIGWAYPLWCRLRKLRAAVERVERLADTLDEDGT